MLGEIQRTVLDCSLAKEELRWQAKVDLEDGIERTLANLEGYRDSSRSPDSSAGE